MPTSSRLRDPDGYYARLGLEPAATQPQIASAFRARARVLHPDVPRTGNAEAFVMLKRAYDVLSHPDRRAEYDRRAQEAEQIVEEDLPLYEEEVVEAPKQVLRVPTRVPRFSDLPVFVWLGMGALLAFTTFEAITHLSSPPREALVEVSPTAPTVPALSASAHRAVLYGPTPVHLAGISNFYVAPSSSPTVLWRLDAARKTLVAMANLPPFSTVQALRLLRQNGLAEVMVTADMNGYVAFDHLTPGDGAAARKAYCGYNTGPVPEDGELLEKRASGNATLTVENRAVQPAVLKLRNTAGAVVLSLFLGPNTRTELGRMPAGSFVPEFAVGELWSRACDGFIAGMRAGRLKQNILLPGNAPVVIAPDDGGAGWTEISEDAFERE